MNTIHTTPAQPTGGTAYAVRNRPPRPIQAGDRVRTHAWSFHGAAPSRRPAYGTVLEVDATPGEIPLYAVRLDAGHTVIRLADRCTLHGR